MALSDSNERCVTLTSSDDEEKPEDLPKIVNAVSLQGCSTFTFDEQPEDNESIFYPQCEIKEDLEKIDKPSVQKTTDNKENGPSNEDKNSVKVKKRLKPTRLTLFKNEPKPSTSRSTDGNVVDASKLALQETLFKTKELFDTFLRVCQDVENSPDMEKVVEKLERVYGQARQEYLGSERFQALLETETEKVNTANTKPWLNLKFILDEMKFNKKGGAPKLKLGESGESQDDKRSDEDEPLIECPKKRRHLKRLEKTLRALNLRIKKLEEKEVNFDDEDSSYVKLDRYRAQFIKIYNKVCEIKGKLADADRPYLRKVSFAGTKYPHINRCIERFYNKHKEFPDFQDIKKLVEIANKQENIELAPVKLHEMATEAFKEFGEMLKRLRQYDDYDIIVSYLEHQVDPARDSKELQEELTKNALLFKKKEQEVLDKFAAQDAGIHSDSDEGSDSKPKRKKKILIKSQKKLKTPKKNFSSSGSSDNSSGDEDDDSARRKTPVPTISSSDESSGGDSKKIKDKGKTPGHTIRSSDESSGGDSKKGKNKSKTPGPMISSSDKSSGGDSKKGKDKSKTPGHTISSSDESSGGDSKKGKDKGKTLVGKKRFVKRGFKLKKTSPVKTPQPQTAISSDEESNPKDTFTNYLGLHSTPIKKISEKDKSEEENEDEIICVPSTADNSLRKTENSSDSDDSKQHDIDSLDSDSKTANGNKLDNETKDYQTKKLIYNSSESESIKSASNNVSNFTKKTKQLNNKVNYPGGINKTTRTLNQSKKSQLNSKNLKLNSQSKPAPRRNSVNSNRISLSSDSDVESAERTSADESEFSAKKSVSDASKAPSIDLSDSSSDGDNKKSEVDEPIVILSEDVVEVEEKSQNSNGNSKDSDSDDVCVLSQSSTETRSVAPRRTKVNSVPKPNNSVPVISRVSGFSTSNPNQKPRGLLKRRASSQFVNGVSKRTRPSGPLSKTSGPLSRTSGPLSRTSGPLSRTSGPLSRPSGPLSQRTVPQVINGATRKTIFSKVPRCKPASSPDTIPLIELD